MNNQNEPTTPEVRSAEDDYYKEFGMSVNGMYSVHISALQKKDAALKVAVEALRTIHSLSKQPAISQLCNNALEQIKNVSVINEPDNL